MRPAQEGIDAMSWSRLARQQATHAHTRRGAAMRAAGWTLLAMTVTALGMFVLG
jgi:hypothetical protein